MATKKSADTLPPDVATDVASDTVKLQCEELGITSKDFDPKHAAALLAFQDAKGLKSWQPVDETPAPAAE